MEHPFSFMTDSKALPRPLTETIAGFVAGVASTLVAHPLDLIKTRLQGNVIPKGFYAVPTDSQSIVSRDSSPRLGSSLRIVRDIARSEGLFSGFYRGLTPNVLGNSVSWGLYFLWYGQLKDGLRALHGLHTGLSSYDYFIASGSAGIRVHSILS